MNTKLLFFGRLAEQIGAQRWIDLPDDGCTIADLRIRLDLEQLAPGGGALASIDRQRVNDDAHVMPGQEIAFFSPLSGG